MNLQFKQLQVKSIQAPNFIMHPVELKDFIDFEVKRFYYITAPIGSTGAHCHKAEKELFTLLSGMCIAVVDYGEGIKEIPMQANDSLYMSNYVWHYFKNFSSDAILFALSSTNYNSDRSDYIEDYEKYKKVVSSIQ